MKLFIFIAAALFALSRGPEAKADSMFYDNCVSQRRADNMIEVQPEFILVADRSGFMGMSCQDLKNVFEGMSTINAVLIPAGLIINRAPGLKESMAAEIAALGLTYANPVVLSIAVGGAITYSVVYIVMKQSLRDCEAKQKEIIEQLRIRFNIPQNTRINIQVDRGTSA